MSKPSPAFLLIATATLAMALICGAFLLAPASTGYAGPAGPTSVQPGPGRPAPGGDEANQPVPEAAAGRVELPMPALPAQPAQEAGADAGWVVSYDPATGAERMLAPVAGGGTDGGAQPGGPGQVPYAQPPAPGAPDSFGDLALISNPASAPWNAVVRLEISHDELPSGTVFICTGVLIDSRHVLTSGNCVFDRSSGYGWASGIRAVPAYQSGATPYGWAFAATFYSFTAWTQNGNTDYNLGYIFLDRPAGALASTLPARDGTDSQFTSTTFSNPGYPPSDLNRPYSRSGLFDAVFAHVLHNYPAHFYYMPGSPAIASSSTWAVYSHRVDEVEIFCRITDTKLSTIQGAVANNTPPQPDLIPLKARAGVSHVEAGAVVDYGFSIHNYSSATWNGSIEYGVYLSSNDDISTADRLLVSVGLSRSIGPKASSLISHAVQIDRDVPPGDYWIGVIITNSDADTGNNDTDGWDAGPIRVDPAPATPTPTPTRTATPTCTRTVTPTATATATARPAELQVSVTSLSFTAVEGSDPPPQEFVVSDRLGGAWLNWEATVSTNWLRLAHRAPGPVPASVAVEVETEGLGTGFYEGYIVVSNRDAPAQNRLIQVTLEMTPGPPPELQVSPAALALELPWAATEPLTGTLTIRNAGSGQMSWSAAVTQGGDWLSLDPPGGHVSTGTDVVTVYVSAPDPPNPGGYTGEITITSPEGGGSPQVVTVNLALLPPPEIRLNKSALLFNAIYEDGAPAAQRITVTSSDGSVLDWAAAVVSPTVATAGDPEGSDAAGWLRLDRTAGSTPDRIQASVDTAGLAIGETYRGAIEISGTREGAAAQRVEVTLTYGTNLALRARPGSLSFLAFTGGADPAAQTITVLKSAGQERSFQWQASSDVSWLEVSPKQGSAAADAPIAVRAKPQGRGPGVYTGKLTISGPAKGSPITVKVTLTVLQPPAFCSSSSADLVKHASAGIRLSEMKATPRGDGGCDLRALMTLTLPQKVSAQRTVSGTVSKDNELSVRPVAGSAAITAKAANVRLVLSNAALTNAGLQADGAWDLTAIGGGKPGAGRVRIDNTRGLSFNGAGEFTFGAAQAISVGGFAGQASKAALKYAAETRSYTLVLAGKVTVRAAGGPEASAGMAATFNQAGLVSAAVDPFTLPRLAGLDLRVGSAVIDRRGLYARGADLKAPKEWGGLQTRAGGLRITSGGAVSMSGSSFALPAIQAGRGFYLTGLRGSLKWVGGEYRIAADGEFELPVGRGAGSCTLNVGVTFRATATGASVLEMRSPGGDGLPAAGSEFGASAAAPAGSGVLSPDGLALGAIRLGVWNCPTSCGIPVGLTGFRLTGVRGEVQLNQGLERVNVEVQVKSEWGIGGASLLSAEAYAAIETRPWALAFGGTVYAAGLKANRTDVRIDAKGFSASLVFDYVLFHADLRVSSWTTGGRFYVTGSGKANVQVEKGRFGRGCVDLVVKELCVDLPPVGFRSPTVKAEFGTFANGSFGLKGLVEYRLEKWGFELIDFRGGFYVDADGDVAIGNVDRYQLVTRPKVLEALRQREAVRRGEIMATAAAAAAEYEFVDLGPNGEVRILVPVAGPASSWADRSEPITVTQRSDLLFAMSQPVDGGLAFTLLDPDGAALTPANLPPNAAYSETIDEVGRQSTYLVAKAAPGAWRAQIAGDTANTDYIMMVVGATPAPELGDLILAPAGAPDLYDAGWRLWSTAPEVAVSIYANDGPISRTVTLPDSPGGPATETALCGGGDVFVGVPVATGLASATDGSPQVNRLDLSALPSGEYHLWLEADDGRNPPVRGYLLQDGAPALVVLDRAGSFPSDWTAGISVAEGPSPDKLAIAWLPRGHPDVDSYRVRLRASDPISPTEEIVAEYVAGAGLSYVAGGIQPGGTYAISIGAEDSRTGRVAWSQDEVVTAASADFIFTLGGGDRVVVLPAGGVVTVPLGLVLSPDLPYPVSLSAGYDLLPDGFEVSFAPEFLTSSGAVAAAIAASADLEPGSYLVPLVASNGFVSHELAVPVDVVPPVHGAHLPLSLRDYRPASDRPTTDEFDGAPLGPWWSWVNESPAHWSLTARPGFLRIEAGPGAVGERNLLLQRSLQGPFELRTRLLFGPTANFQAAGLVLYQDEDNYLLLSRAYCDVPGACVGDGIYFDHYENGAAVGGNFATAAPGAGEVYLALTRIGDSIAGSYSTDNVTWHRIGVHSLGHGLDLSRAGLAAGQDSGGAGIPADFDFFRVAELFYADDFSDPAGGWSSGEDELRRWGYLDGEYQILLKAPMTGRGVTPDLVLPADFRVEADMRRVGEGRTASWGLIFSFRLEGDSYEFYEASIDPEGGKYLVEKRNVDGSWEQLRDWTPSAAIRPGQAINHLSIERRGTEIRVAINGVAVSPITDASIVGAGLDAGVRAWSADDAPVDVRFDNFTVVALSGP